MKLVPDSQPASGVDLAASSQVMFAVQKRKKMRGAVL
jgi:hypothetical protein